MSRMTINVDREGRAAFVWDDRLAFLRDLGTCATTRASHVEPTPDGRWTADMQPSNGPILGPFLLRSEALRAERDWLRHERRL